MISQKYNFHTHTYRCQHAKGDIADYCQAASKLGLQSLGFSDHTPLPDGLWPKVRMKLSQLPAYCQKIDAAKLDFPQLKIYKGLECEYDSDYQNFFQDVLLQEFQMDYLIGSVHWFPRNSTWINAWKAAGSVENLLAYSKYIIRIMHSGLFDFIAHPDLFAAFYRQDDANSRACSRDILAAAAELQIPLEINGYGFQKKQIKTASGSRPMYPWDTFWQIASTYPIIAVANSDAHKPANVYGCIDQARALAQKYQLQLATEKQLLRK
ncbi:MAG: histidinol-phosphatase [Candidatus Cloacimonadales bacterium]